jgi:hypothetical protein
VWVDDQGGVLELKGNLKQEAMVLRSDLLKGKESAMYYHRITWQPNENEVVQTWEVLDNTHQVKSLLFKGFYRKTGS